VCIIVNKERVVLGLLREKELASYPEVVAEEVEVRPRHVPTE